MLKTLRAQLTRLAVLGLGAAGILAVYTALAGNTTFTVNSNDDDVDKTIGDGICATVNNVCTLRAAIQESNSTTGTKVINFGLGSCSGTSTNSGLRGTYFNNTGLTGTPVLTRYEAVNFDWVSGSPSGAVNTDNFSVRWTGTLTIPTTGSYNFQTVSDDGVRLWLNGTQVINNWNVHPTATDNSASISYTAGQQVSVTLEYYEATGSAEIALNWKKPSTSTYVSIPIAQLTSPAVGNCVIQPLSALPNITRAMTINGTTQAGYAANAPVVQIDGSYAGTGVTGLTAYNTSGVVIRSLVISNFDSNGITLDTTSGSTLAGNSIGTTVAGTAAAANGADGISLWNSPGNTIGGTATADRNVLSGNGNNGLVINGTSTGNTVLGNYVGTDASGTAALANGAIGMYINAASTVLGGSTAGYGNVVSGNTSQGIYLATSATSTQLKGNYIGLNADGTAAVGNGGYGLYVAGGSTTIGGTATGAGNVISGNSANGLWIASSSNTVQGNLIGLDATGSYSVSNTNSGMVISGGDSNTIGGSATGARNVISGNTTTGFNGIHIRDGSNTNVLKGNYFGTDITGTVAVGNAYAGIRIGGGSNNTVGGTAAGEANVLANNTVGVEVIQESAASAGNIISGNSIYGNSGGGIYLEAALPANDGTTTASTGNLKTDSPVFTAASYVGTTLTLAGYVGSAAGQAAFANHTVEVFVSSVTSGNGQGLTYLGALSTGGSNGTFSGTITTSSLPTGSRITATARSTAGNTSIFSTVFLPTYTYSISGTVFEDVNYGGGAGRTKATALAGGGAVRPGARVELYTVSGTTATMSVAATTDASGNYSFTGLANGNYAVRVVSSTVTSSRTGAVASLIPVTTYRASGSTGAAVAVTNEVGGTGPSVTAFYNAQASVGASSSTTSSYAEAFSLVTVSSAAVPGMDFGYNFNTVTNVNDTGQGSLRQAITNANTLGGDASLAQQGLTSGIENVVFMISHGVAGAGLRASNNYFTGGIATLSPASAYPAISSPLVLDAQTQPNWTANPVIELNGTSAGASSDGLQIGGAGSTVRGFIINRFKRHGLYVAAANATVQGCWIGVNSAGGAASANTLDGIYAAYTGHTIGGTGSTQRNLVSGNTRHGIVLAADAGSAGNSTVAGNYVGTDQAGSGAVANGSNGVYVLTTGNTIGGATSGAGNLISGNTLNGVQIDAATNTVQGNTIGLALGGNSALANASHGIYIGAGTGHVIGGGTSLHRNVISGNASGGIFVNAGGSNTIQGNYIGTNADGTVAIGNASYFGLEVYGSGSNQIGGTTNGQGNVISGQSGAGKGGIYLASNSNTLQGNLIGTNATASGGLANAGPGIAIAVGSITGNTIGGTATGAGNTIAFNGQQGVAVSGASATGNRISRNAIYSNTGIGIDIAAAGRNANNGSKTATLGNQEMDTPVISSTLLNGSSLTLTGYVGSLASQATFASATVEVFKVLSDGTGYGQGQVYLGTLTADASGNFNTAISVSGLSAGDVITATATDASGNTSEFSANVTVASLSISGTVFEDVNYGGGAGRSLASAGGVGLSGARVELYNSSATFVSATTTASDGSYTFNSLNSNDNYFVRVVNSTVLSSRSGSVSTLLPVMTYRTETATTSVAAVTTEVGGVNPAGSDTTAGTTGTSLWTVCAAEGGTCSFTGTRVVRYGANSAAGGGWATLVLTGGTACTNTVFGDPFSGTGKSCYLLNADVQSLATVHTVATPVAGVDFGFNFDAVVNTNNSGQGSLRQAITNANTLGGDSSLAQSGRTAGIENLVFMISNGTAGSGLRSGLNYFTTSAGSYNVATITPTSLLPTITSPLVLDAQTQPGWTLPPLIELNGSSAGATTTSNGLQPLASNCVIRGFVINRFAGEGIYSSAGNSITIQGNRIGTNAAGSAASANSRSGIFLSGSGTTGHQIGGTTAAQRNVISGNTRDGIALGGASSSFIQGNHIGVNANADGLLGNGMYGVEIAAGLTGNTIGGTTAGMGNVIAGNGLAGVVVAATATGQAIQGNSIYGNTGIGIDLNADGASANDGLKTAGAANLKMDHPVFTSVSLSGTTLTLAGYVGNAAGMSLFGAARVEVFVADNSSGAGQGQTYLGFLTADASGNFSGTLTGVSGLTAGTSKITGTATDSSSNTSEFGANVTVGYGLSGFVYEDLNYGGGAGRSKVAASGGSGRSGARVELYTVSGSTATYSAATTTDGLGAYAFSGLAAGNYAVRVVGASVSSSRSGYTAALLPVLTYRADASTGTATAVTDNVGGTTPSATDGGNGAAATTFSTTTGVFSAGTTGTAQAYSLATVSTGVISGLDFGFNFDTVVNTNDSGAGSLRQAITNANTLGGDSSLAQNGRTAAIENLVFMISNGTAAAGLRSGLNHFSGGVASIAVTSALPGVSTPMVLNAQTQPGWNAAPIVEIYGSGLGPSVSGLELTAGSSTVRGFVINRFTGSGINLYDNGGNTVAGNYIGTNAAGTAASANGGVGLNVYNSSGNTLGGTTTSSGNLISGNAAQGVVIGGTATVLQGNIIGLDAAGALRLQNGSQGVYVNSSGAVIGGTSVQARNVIAGNYYENIKLDTGGSNATIQGNHIGVNASGAAGPANGSTNILISSSGNTVGGTVAGAGNTIGNATGRGVLITGAVTGNTVQGNSIFGNSVLGIDLGTAAGVADGITANDGLKTTGQPNLRMDHPVFTSASLSGTTLTVAGYVGNSAGQSAFASARVEVFVSDGTKANGQGKTYLGFLTTDASGNFSGTITGVSGVTNGTTKITGTATDGSGNTSEFGVNVTVGMALTGTVFEDANYGGGAGRSLAASSGAGVSGATVELYNSSGIYVSSTTTGSGGTYSFSSLAATTYYVRVVNRTVLSQRSGAAAILLPVMTYRTTATTGTAVAVTDFVGGTSPSLTDPASASSGAAFNTSTYVYSAGLTGTAQSVAAVTLSSGGVGGVDFGFNFDTVVNTNDSGPGSLRQVLTNADTLGGDASLAVAGRTAAIEHVVFMIPNGTAAAGLRSANTAFSSGIASIALASTLPTLANPVVIDAQQQPGWTVTPVVELNGASAGASTNGLTLNGAGSTVRGLAINRFGQNGITTATGTGLVIEGNHIGTDSAGTAASANAQNGILISGGSATIGGLTASTRNVISGNTQNGVSITGGSATVRGNRIGSDATNSGVVANGGSGVSISGSNSTVGGTAAGAGNVIRGNGGQGVAIANGAYTGNAILGNSIYGNSSLGIDLKADGLTAANDGARTAATANLSMDSPVFTSASISGTTLTVAGYVGSAASQSTFATARVEIFVSDASSSAGQGQTYLGTLTTDASGNFSGSLSSITGVSNGTTRITATATDTGNNTSEFGANVTVGMAVSGTVFEDANYGGGAGRSLAGSSGAGVSGATLELYDNSGVFVTSTTSGSGGAYSFVGLAAGTYHVRVVSSTVLSQRSGSAAGLLPVLTFRTTATSGAAVAVTDFVGGTNPAFADPGAASAGATFSTVTYAYSSGLSGTAHAVAPVTVGSASIGAVDFGFNFDTVSNTNASGPGSLAQVLTNANTLGGDASLAQSGRTAAVENVVFMIPNGTAGSGLRSTFNHFVGGVATISPSSALPTVTNTLVLDAQTQPGWAGPDPIVRLSGASAGTADGLTLDAASCTVRGFIVGGFTGAGLMVNSNASGSAVQGNWLGLAGTGANANANTRRGLEVNGVNGLIVGGTTAARRNVISGNSLEGVLLNGTANVFVTGNYIGTKADGTAAVANGGNGGLYLLGGATASTIGGTATGAGNVISGNALRAITIETGTHTLQGNFIGLNAAGTAALVNSGGSAIYLSGTAGAQTIGGTTAAARNVIVSTTYHGINVAVASAAGTTIQGNHIGTDAAGTTVLGSGTGGLGGVFINGAGTGIAVGGTAAGAGNLIRGYGSGVLVVSGSGSAILGNSIAGNSGLGIDLKGDGVTANDGAKTTGQANLLMDSPVFTSARATGDQLVVSGYIGTAAGQSVFAGARVEVFLSDNDGTGFGEGKTYLGALTADGSGNFSGTLTMPITALAIGSKLTATATDTASNTSEFGANFSGLIVDLVVNDKGDAADALAGDGLCATAGGVCTLRAAITELNAWASLATPPSIVFALPGCSTVGAAACTITPASALPSVTRTVLIDGTSQAGFSTVSYSPIVEISGASAPGGTTGLVVSASNSTVRGLTINRFSGIGVTLSGTGNTLVGMRIGLAAATATTAANGGAGAYISGTGSVIGGSTAADRNVIAGNTGAGITVGAGSTTITGNWIGTDASATSGLGNGVGGGGSGIAVLSASLTGVVISGNTLANNGGAGVGVAAGGPSQVQIGGNSMSGNTGLGIDLGNDGVTANTGISNTSLPNQGMNMPVITGAGVGTNAVTVYGHIGTGTGQAAFAGARVEFFKAAADSSGYGEGVTYLGFLTADSAGRFTGTVAYAAGALNVGDGITATATDAAGNTSEFGPNWTTTSVAALTPGAFNAFDASTAAGALTGTITSKVAGTAASFAVIALDNSGTALHPGFTGTVSLTWVDARDDSGALTGSCRTSWVDKGSAGSATFSNNSRVTVALTPPASGTRSMRLKMSYTGGGSTVTACSNDAFADLPASYSWTGASDADSSTAGTARALDNTGASGGVVHRAGRPFTVRARALDATGAVMTGYDGSPVLAAAGCLLPSGCAAATLTAPSTASTAGVYTNNLVSYAEVGALQVQLTDASYADVDAADTAIGVRTLTSTLLAVGRFIPDSYSVALSTNGQLGTANAACLASGAGATFIGQGFGWATAPQVTVTALNAAGATTARWTGSLMKLTAGSGLTETLTASGTGGATFSASYGTVTVTDLGAGQARVTASSTDRFLLDLASGSVQDSTTPTFAWSLAISDASEAAVSGNPTLTATANQGSVAFNSGGVFYSGRLSLSPGYGDVRSGVHLLAQLQRYTAAGWVTMTEDQGCVTIQNQNVAVETPTGVFATLGACAAPMTGSVTTRGGRAWLAFPGTPAGAPGRLTLRLAGPAATGNSCTTAGASAALVPLSPNWLLGGASAVGPQALATWGKPQRDALLRRETW